MCNLQIIQDEFAITTRKFLFKENAFVVLCAKIPFLTKKNSASLALLDSKLPIWLEIQLS